MTSMYNDAWTTWRQRERIGDELKQVRLLFERFSLQPIQGGVSESMVDIGVRQPADAAFKAWLPGVSDQLDELALLFNCKIDDLAAVLQQESLLTRRAINDASAQVVRAVNDTAEHIGQQVAFGTFVNLLILHQLIEMDRRAEERAQRTLERRANERYRQALQHFSHAELELCLGALEKTLDQDSTHPLAWELLGRTCERIGRPRSARAAYKRAAQYAEDDSNHAARISIAVRLARLERKTGNPRAGCAALGSVLDDDDCASISGSAEQYEYCKCLWAALCSENNPRRVEEILPELIKAFVHASELVDEVATHPFWARLVVEQPWMGYGDAPFRGLCLYMVVVRLKLIPALSFDLPRDLTWWDTDQQAVDDYLRALDKCRLGKQAVPPDLRQHFEICLQLLASQQHERMRIMSIPGRHAFMVRSYGQLCAYIGRSIPRPPEPPPAPRPPRREEARPGSGKPKMVVDVHKSAAPVALPKPQPIRSPDASRGVPTNDTSEWSQLHPLLQGCLVLLSILLATSFACFIGMALHG